MYNRSSYMRYAETCLPCVYFWFIALRMYKVWYRPDDGVRHIYRDARIPGNMPRTSIILYEGELHIPKG